MNNETPVSRRRANDKSCHGKLALSGKVLRKYRLLHSVRQFGVSYKSMSERQTTEKKKTYLQRISQTVQEFFVSSSRMTTDKTDTITRKKIKHQRMILTDSMLNLHIEQQSGLAWILSSKIYGPNIHQQPLCTFGQMAQLSSTRTRTRTSFSFLKCHPPLASTGPVLTTFLQGK